MTTTHTQPAEIRSVRGEQLQLSPEAPHLYSRGTRLRAIQAIAPGQGTTVKGTLVPSSVVVRVGERVLEEGRDYLLEHDWGTIGLGPEPTITADESVNVDYDYSLLRLDSWVRTRDGQEELRLGKSHLTVPQPPRLAAGETRLANLLVPYHSDGRNAECFPLLASAGEANTLTTVGRVPRTLAKLILGQRVKIVCWGDSVTDGGDVSSVEHRFSAVFERRLKERFPYAEIEVETIAVGGSQSVQWLDPQVHPFPSPEKQALGRFERIAAAKPDLVTVEFVNDTTLNEAQFQAAYGEILRRMQALGAEVIFITPHFTMPEMMGFTSLKDAEKRPYVLALRDFAEKHQVALADAASRWEHLWQEGLPYITLLQNGINHPEDRGHAMFADELMKCFATVPARASEETQQQTQQTWPRQSRDELPVELLSP